MPAGKDRSSDALAGSLAIGGLRVAAPAFRLGVPSLTAAPELDWLLGAHRDVEASPRPVAPAPAARAPSRTGPGVVLDVTSVGPSVRIFRVGRPEGFVFEAGQSLKLSVDGAAVRRRYSIASAPHEQHLEFCIEGVPGGALTSRLFALRPGAQLTLASAAKGSFTLRTDKQRHVLVATVTGIAPLRSMLRDALARGTAEAAEFWVLHGASYADELPYADELTALASQHARIHYVPSVSRPWAARNQGWSGSRGRVDTLVLPTLQALGSKQDVAVYACGHPEMVRSVRDSLEPRGYLVLDEAYD